MTKPNDSVTLNFIYYFFKLSDCISLDPEDDSGGLYSGVGFGAEPLIVDLKPEVGADAGGLPYGVYEVPVGFGVGGYAGLTGVGLTGGTAVLGGGTALIGGTAAAGGTVLVEDTVLPLSVSADALCFFFLDFTVIIITTTIITTTAAPTQITQTR